MSNKGTPSILVIRSGRHQGRLLTLPEGDVLVGRDEECRIRLGSSDVSRRHCRLRATADGVVVEDLGSRNGTHVNDVRIERPTTLEPGDVVRIGPLVFEVPKGDGTSEDDIAGWLSGVEDTTSPSDTTILPPHKRQDVPPPSRDRFESVAEEAEDIIRRHHEMKRRQDGGK